MTTSTPIQQRKGKFLFALWIVVWLSCVDLLAQSSYIVTQTETSDPPNLFVTLVTQTNCAPGAPAIPFHTQTAPITVSGYRFTEWTVNGVRAQDFTGEAINPAPTVFTNNVNITAIAHYLPASQYTADTLVPDWYKVAYFGTTNINASNNPSGDGFSIAVDYLRGYDPLLFNQIIEGGVSRRRSASTLVIVNTNLVQVSATSQPFGLYSAALQILAKGSIYSLPAVPSYSGYGFIGWFVGSNRVDNAQGFSSGTLNFTISNNTAFVAEFLPSSQDSDGDGIADCYELYYFNSLTNTGASNPSGDGFSIATDILRGYQPNVFNQIIEGGISRRRSASTLVIVNTNLAQVSATSQPFGLYSAALQILAKGSIYSLPAVPSYSGYGFIGWFIGTNRVDDPHGFSSGNLNFTISNNTTFVAEFLPSGQDSDGDGIADCYELYYFNSLTNTGASNPSGDGFSIATDILRGYQPNVFNQIIEGGISRRRSASIRILPQPFAFMTDLLVNGVDQKFFSTTGTTNTGHNFGANTAPALGDWNGDGVLDLFVGASNGELQVFENTGSPVVPNLVERTTNFTVLAPLWAGVNNLAPALGDWTGDGKADLAIGGDTGRVVLISSTGNFLSPQQPAITSVLMVASSSAIPALADVTGDGRADLFVLLADGTVNLYTNSGNALNPFSPSAVRTNLLRTAVAETTGIAAVDMDGDGIVDVLISDNRGRILEFHGDATGNYSLLTTGLAGSHSGFADRLAITAGDFNGDGNIDIVGGFSEGGILYLENLISHLLISPPSVTLVNGNQITFSNLTSTGIVTWSLLRSPSGGSINPSNGFYTAGTGTGMDFVQAVATNGLTGRAYVNVISTNDVASFGKAVVIGGGRDLNDPVWLASDYIASKAYNVLRYKGYSRENIQYLSFNPGRDIDGDGLTNDIAGFSSFANAAGTFTNWVGNANRLFVYLVDHGAATSDGAYFRLNTGENLTSIQLNTWLTAIQNQYGTEVIVVLDFCYAGRFVQDLAYAGPAKRVVLAATSPTELTYFLSGGYVSFSDLFLSGLLEGLNLQQAFLFAQQGMQGYQNPIMDDTKDGIYQTNVDGTVAATIQIGATHLAGKDVPVIGTVAASQTLSSGTKATLWADGIQSYYPMDRVYGTILPPSFAANTNAGVPVTGVSEVTLTPDSSGRYQADFDGFTEAGVYRVNYYARDIWGSVSPPLQGLVIQVGYDERMILVTGGKTNDAQWAATAYLAATAYQTALVRRLGKTHIQCLSAVASQDLDGDGTNDVAGITSAAALGNAITNWAAGASKLTLYLLGSSITNGLCRLNATETLSATQLDGWLDNFQQTNRSVTTVLDFDGSGSYIPSLLAPTNRERISIASAQPGTNCVRAAGGLVSFSQFFLSGIFNGQSLGSAFNAARNAIKNASGRVKQTPQLDDNGNGIADEKNVDGLLAAQRYLGAVFATGEDTPYIGAVTPATNIVGGTPVLLWAQNILSGVGISNVWCVSTAPDYDGTGDLPQTNLTWNAATSRYEVLFTNFTQLGAYACTFYARDNSGQLSSAQQSTVTILGANLSPVAVSASFGANGTFQVAYQGFAGNLYALEESTNLVNWVPRLTNQVPQNGILSFSITNPPATTRAFYRARLIQ